MWDALRSLDADGRLLFATRFVRLFAYGALSVVLVLYLVGLGLSEADTGVLLTATLLGDTLVSLYLTTQADRIGRRRMLIAGTALMVAAGLAFAFTREMWLLVVAGTIGVISPSGQEVGPFLPIEQAALSQVVPDHARTDVFAWYTLAGALATALGALAAGFLTSSLQRSWTPVDSYRAVVVGYALLGAVLLVMSNFSGWSQNDPRYQDAIIKVHDAALKYGKYYGNAGEQYLRGYTVSADTRMVQNGPACDGWRPAGRGRGRGTGPEEEPVIGLAPGTAPKPGAAAAPSGIDPASCRCRAG